MTDEPEPAARAIAEVALRRALFPGHPFGFVQPSSGWATGLWGFVQAAAAVHAGGVALVLGRPDATVRADRPAMAALRAASSVGKEVAAATIPGTLTGAALEHARSLVSAATAALDRLADGGWRTVSGDPPGVDQGGSLRFETIAERTEAFDPFEAALKAAD